MKQENPIISLINSHTSVRKYRSDAGVSEDDEREIIKAAQRASTSCNVQAYTFISVRDRKKLETLAVLSDNSSPIRESSLFLVVCVDEYRLNYATEKAGLEYYQFRFLDSFVMGIVDAALAAQNAALAAESLGYGVCYIGAFRHKIREVSRLLGLPKRVFPVFGLALGVPERKNPLKARLPIEGVWFKETYDAAAAERAVQEYDKTMAASGVYEGRRFPLMNRRIREGVNKAEGEHYGWIEHTSRRLSSTEEEDTRSGLKKALGEAGFLFE